MFVLEGRVAEVIEHGFVLESGTRVVTQTPGRRLGLRPGDHVRVTGGPGGDGEFLSSSASKQILFGWRSVRVPVREGESRSWLWWL